MSNGLVPFTGGLPYLSEDQYEIWLKTLQEKEAALKEARQLVETARKISQKAELQAQIAGLEQQLKAIDADQPAGPSTDTNSFGPLPNIEYRPNPPPTASIEEVPNDSRLNPPMPQSHHNDTYNQHVPITTLLPPPPSNHTPSWPPEHKPNGYAHGSIPYPIPPTKLPHPQRRQWQNATPSYYRSGHVSTSSTSPYHQAAASSGLAGALGQDQHVHPNLVQSSANVKKPDQFRENKSRKPAQTSSSSNLHPNSSRPAGKTTHQKPYNPTGSSTMLGSARIPLQGRASVFATVEPAAATIGSKSSRSQPSTDLTAGTPVVGNGVTDPSIASLLVSAISSSSLSGTSLPPIPQELIFGIEREAVEWAKKVPDGSIIFVPSCDLLFRKRPQGKLGLELKVGDSTRTPTPMETYKQLLIVLVGQQAKRATEVVNFTTNSTVGATSVALNNRPQTPVPVSSSSSIPSPSKADKKRLALGILQALGKRPSRDADSVDPERPTKRRAIESQKAGDVADAPAAIPNALTPLLQDLRPDPQSSDDIQIAAPELPSSVSAAAAVTSVHPVQPVNRLSQLPATVSVETSTPQIESSPASNLRHSPPVARSGDPVSKVQSSAFPKPSDVSSELPSEPPRSPSLVSETPLFLPSRSPSVVPTDLVYPDAGPSTSFPTISKKTAGKRRVVYVEIPDASEYVRRFKAISARKKQREIRSVKGNDAEDEIEDFEDDRAEEEEIEELMDPSSSTSTDGYVPMSKSAPPSDPEEMRITKESCTRLRECSCKWGTCGAVINSAENLLKHLQLHIEEDPDLASTDIVCLWPECGQAFSSKKSLLPHVALHACTPMLCAYEGCNASFSAARHLLRHYRGLHSNDSLRPTPNPFEPDKSGDLPEVPESLPSYLTVPRRISRHPMSKQRHAELGVWVLRNSLGPIHVPKKAASLTNAQHLQEVARDVRGSGTHDYDFLYNSSVRSSNPSVPAKLRSLPNLDSRDVTTKVAEGLVILADSDDDEEVELEDILTGYWDEVETEQSVSTVVGNEGEGNGLKVDDAIVDITLM